MGLSVLFAGTVDFVTEVQPLLKKHCFECHGEKKQKSGLRLDIKSMAMKGGDQFAPNILPGNAKGSPLVQFIGSQNKEDQMPPKGERLSPMEIATVSRWIDEGAHWPESSDTRQSVEHRLHWSFQPITNPQPPKVTNPQWARNPIDRFVLSRLEREKLKPSPEADRVTWIRRVFYDLIGLPPTPESVERFIHDKRPDAFERIVDEILKSPRYGERWAQHWLDVVRYADTHGFEVNTERPNAWPYRDYVIRSFNNDTPYDRFMREQLVGDLLKEDAATGFLVTASVLLSGQIGADEPSKRLARQDSLDEMVVNTSQTFLALSVGCARCHDHKFDPISQIDYYAMQSFFAGVEYDDREIHSPETYKQRDHLKSLEVLTAKIQSDLAQVEPMARVVSVAKNEPNPRFNEITFPPTEARFVRFTIHDANLHPTLGLIEPCLDEFEILTGETTPRNVALLSHGTKVSASGSRQSESHRLEHINDGKYGNHRSWMSDEAGRGWLVFELSEATQLGKIRWSRDREGNFTDRLVTAYTIEAGMSLATMTQLAFVPPPRPEVNPRMNSERFAPIKAKQIRFTIKKTNNLEPCLDELEVFDSQFRNIALASLGTKVSSSGDTTAPNRHELRFINDGLYGNSHSWMSHTQGMGRVTLEFSSEQTIARVVWGRDRDGEFKDRLATDYLIEVANASGQWQTLADGTDRRPYNKGVTTPFSTAGLSPAETTKAESLLTRKKKIENEMVTAKVGLVAFAGTFRNPDKTFLLSRGDPEQPKEEIAPALPRQFHKLTLPIDTAEQERRVRLADWMADPKNPLPARVMVNRIWQGHFGIGLVETPSDFGHNGARVTHPELLDWFASEFVNSGWSVKHLHRLIVLSATYRQSNRIHPRAQAKDSEDRWLWRFPSRRIEAETIRDAMLHASGRLSESMYGRGFDLFDLRGGLSGFKPVESFNGEGLRRMVYAHKIRREREAVFGAFDCPDAGQSTARRRESTTPIQALNLFNSRFTWEEAQALATRSIQEVGEDLKKQIHRVWQLTLSRSPSPAELEEAEPIVREHGLATLCRSLFNCNEFLLLP